MKLNQAFKVLSLATVLALAASTVTAQENNNDRPRRNRDGANADQGGGGRNFDPAEFRQRMAERLKEQLEITDDKEWQAIEPLVTKVSEARMAAFTGGRGFGGRGGRGGPGGPGGLASLSGGESQR